MPSISRRNFVFLTACATLAPHGIFDAVPGFASTATAGSDTTGMGAWSHPYAEIARVERARVMADARRYLRGEPKTITSVRAPHSAGGLHDYFSEGDYWWPNPKDPNGPYIRRDGESNPANFVAHRDLLIRLSVQMPALTAAWRLTGEHEYARHAIAHLRAWFVTPATRMNPNLEYAQAIHGICTGRSIGIIDTVQLVEVAQAALVLERAGLLAGEDQKGTRNWFSAYLDWLTTSSRGHEERDKKNNHGSCWLLQAAGFATYTGNNSVREYCRKHLTTVLFPEQIALNGSFPLELARTKPYNYSLFNLDILAMSAKVLSTPAENLWAYRLDDGRGLKRCFEFMVPYIADKKSWPYPPDVEYFNDLPIRRPDLLFAGLVYRKRDYLALWERLKAEPTVPEIIRNDPIRQPLLWVGPTAHG